MIEDRLQKLEKQIEASADLPEESRGEMLRLLAALKSEIAASEASPLAIPPEPEPPTGLETAYGDLRDFVKQFESSHPDLAASINRLSIVLSNMGM